jgi:hypothetical protein
MEPGEMVAEFELSSRIILMQKNQHKVLSEKIATGRGMPTPDIPR